IYRDVEFIARTDVIARVDVIAKSTSSHTDRVSGRVELPENWKRQGPRRNAKNAKKTLRVLSVPSRPWRSQIAQQLRRFSDAYAGPIMRPADFQLNPRRTDDASRLRLYNLNRSAQAVAHRDSRHQTQWTSNTSPNKSLMQQSRSTLLWALDSSKVPTKRVS